MSLFLAFIWTSAVFGVLENESERKTEDVTVRCECTATLLGVVLIG